MRKEKVKDEDVANVESALVSKKAEGAWGEAAKRIIVLGKRVHRNTSLWNCNTDDITHEWISDYCHLTRGWQEWLVVVMVFWYRWIPVLLPGRGFTSRSCPASKFGGLSPPLPLRHHVALM